MREGTMKRLFIALAMPEEALPAVIKAQEELKAAVPGAKWVDPRGAHITLKFLGSVPEETAADIVAVLDEAVGGLPAYTYAIRGLGGFPTPTRPRVVWAGIDDGGQTAELSKPIERAMGWLGFKPEDRDFHPHITLGRVKTPRWLEKPDALAEIGQGLEVEGLRALDVTLFESKLSPKGATYIAISRASLKDTTGVS